MGAVEFAGQFKHVELPKYVLGGHCTHGPLLGPFDKALQTQSVMAVLPDAEIEFDGHSEQDAGPNPDLYWFSRHCEHMSVLVPVYPGLHWQLDFEMVPFKE